MNYIKFSFMLAISLALTPQSDGMKSLSKLLKKKCRIKRKHDEENKVKSIIENLPNEVWALIFSYLCSKDHINVSNSSHYFKDTMRAVYPFFVYPKGHSKKLQDISSDNIEDLLVLHKIVKEFNDDYQALFDYLNFFKFSSQAINIKDFDKITALEYAIRLNKNNFAKALIKKDRLIISDQKNKILLFWAVENQNKEIFSWLIKKGAQDLSGNNFSQLAIIKGNGEDTFFLDQIEHLKPKDFFSLLDQGKTALLIAVELNKVKYVSWILEKIKKSDYSEQARQKFISQQLRENADTALHIACKKKLPDIIRLLLQAGANRNLINSEKKKPKEYIDPKVDKRIALIFINF